MIEPQPLCESRRLLLQPDRDYRFFIDKACVSCRTLEFRLKGEPVPPVFYRPLFVADDESLMTELEIRELFAPDPVEAIAAPAGPEGKWQRGGRIVDLPTSETIAVEVPPSDIA